MSCTGLGAADIGNWATGIWINLGAPSSLSALTISGYATQNFTIGKLNAYTALCYSGVSGTYICPDLDDGGFAILEQMFLQSYYLQLMQANGGAGGTTRIVASIADGDSKIVWQNGVAMAKVYLEASQTATKNLNNLVRNYNNQSQGGNLPRDVSYYNIDNSWNGIYPNSYFNLV